MVLQLVLHQPLGFQLLQVVPCGVEGKSQASRKLLGSQRLSSFELDQHMASRTGKTKGHARIVERNWSSHGGNHK